MPSEHEFVFGDVAADHSSADDLIEEEVLRSEISVRDLLQLDLDDPATPSRRTATGEPASGSFDVPLHDRTRGASDGG